MTTVANAPRPHRTKQRANGEGSIFQLKDGTWVAHTTYHGKAVRRKGKTRREAATKLKAWLKLRESGIDPRSDGWTLHNWLDHWLADTVKPRYDADGVRYQGREEPTYANYERSVRRHIKPYFRDRQLPELQPEHVEAWQRRMAADGISPENQRAALVRLGTALELATRRGHMARNVARYVDRPEV
ncbi:MAG: hypothetical protein JO023_20465, partial [Chloroflexi bacterium]|nr:hypothetical protein [Chloroflexota bacterium]